MLDTINPFDKDALRNKVRNAVPYPHFCIDNFLEETFAHQVADSFPSFHDAQTMGRKFEAVNEKGKIQITDSSKFPPPIKRLHETLASQEWLDIIGHVMDMPNLLADPSLRGGGIHETGPRGHLDVHVDFNYLKEEQLHRRLNILVYMNREWRDEWGGKIEIWDKDVKIRHEAFSPIFNRCVVFETNDISYHGVTAVTCPPDRVRSSFAAYYYTKEAPSHWTGEYHSTIFKARPDEKMKGMIQMPAEKLKRSLGKKLAGLKGKIKS